MSRYLAHAGGTFEFDSGEVVDLAPGDVVRLHAGERTRWTVTETLRKIYLTPTQE